MNLKFYFLGRKNFLSAEEIKIAYVEAVRNSLNSQWNLLTYRLFFQLIKFHPINLHFYWQLLWVGLAYP